jgi:hypothetical protein
MLDEEELNQIINKLENIKNELIELQTKSILLLEKTARNNLFDAINKITNGSVISIIYVDDEEVKYLTKYPEKDGYGIYLVDGRNKYIYDWWNYLIKDDKTILMDYIKKYPITDDIIKLIKILHESPVENLHPNFIKLYHFLKKGYKLVITDERITE